MSIWSELAAAIDAESVEVRSFVALLQREQKSLSEGDIDALPELIELKTAAAAALSHCAAARNACLNSRGLESDRPGIDTWLAGNPADNFVRASWATLVGLAAEARELYRLNGELLRLRLQHNRQALDALLSASGAVQLYGPDGLTSSLAGGRLRDSV